MGYVYNPTEGEQVIYEAQATKRLLVPYIVLTMVAMYIALTMVAMYIVFAMYTALHIFVYSTGFALGLGPTLIIGQLFYIKNTELKLTNKRLFGETGLLSTYSINSPLDEVENVTVSYGFYGKRFNYGAVLIMTKTGMHKFERIEDPEKARTAIMNQIDKLREAGE